MSYCSCIIRVLATFQICVHIAKVWVFCFFYKRFYIVFIYICSLTAQKGECIFLYCNLTALVLFYLYLLRLIIKSWNRCILYVKQQVVSPDLGRWRAVIMNWIINLIFTWWAQVSWAIHWADSQRDRLPQRLTPQLLYLPIHDLAHDVHRILSNRMVKWNNHTIRRTASGRAHRHRT